MKKDLHLDYTGERLVPEIIEYWSIEHLHRYALAMAFIQSNSVVVDVASGEGYGTYLMSEKAGSITGVDISQEAVDHASRRYTRPNLVFKHGSATSIPVPDASVDILTSFETIEHHDQHEEMMREIKRVLKPNGLFIISSPDRKFYSDLTGYKNPFHVKELYKDEFAALISKHFSNHVVFNQKSIMGSVVVPDNNKGAGIEEYSGDYNGIGHAPSIEGSVYTIIIASQSPLPKDVGSMNSIFHNQHVFERYTKTYEKYHQVFTQNQVMLNSNAFKIGRLITYPFRVIKSVLSGK
ncbi:MAG TPA: class I SAM-dependent methyltransferase [Cyclobacteriaceae bacterium]|nr:class I SAM-dependent methyltransferase [Cyclobacteriaceae bacterium]